MKKKNVVGVVLAVACLAAFYFLPGVEGLSHTGMTTIGMLISFLILLIFEALPMVVTCFLFLGLMPILGVTPNFSGALSGFSNQVVFFILASFGIAAAFTEIPLSKRILKGLMKVFGKNVKSMLFAMMLCAALLSSVVSNVPTCAIFMAIGLNFLEVYTDADEKKRTGRAFMIGIPVASMIGGMMTPAGSSINLLAIGLLEDFTGATISFIQWMAIGIPLTVLALPVAWWLIVKVYKPVELPQSAVRGFGETLDVPPKMGSKEIKVLVIMAVMMVFWVLSSWIRSINVMVVALLGCTAMFLPGIQVLEIKKFLRENSWDSFFLNGAVLSLGAAMVTNGVSAWIGTLMPSLQLSLPLLIAFTAVLVFVLLILIPVAPSLVTIMTPPLIALATAAGVSPTVIIMALALCACNCYLLPLDTVTLLTYGTGYYSMTDMAKSTLPLQIWMVVIISIWLSVMGKVVGLI
ncbi:MAG: sodium:sulfate symporter [Oscillospiraceae bacterium]|nr:sodium:sulfate symporter [Oscillospiraceae bacterium]